MNRLTSWARTVIVAYRRNLTDTQTRGDACARCGRDFQPGEDSWPHGIDESMGVCWPGCTLQTVPAVEELFAKRVPGAVLYRLGVEGAPDPDYLASLPCASLVIRDGRRTVRTGTIPLSYSHRIQAQAEAFGMRVERLDLDQEVVTPHGPGLVLNLGAVGAHVVHVTLDDGSVRTYPEEFVKPQQRFGAR